MKEELSHTVCIDNNRVNLALFRRYCEWIRDRLFNRTDAYVLNPANGEKYSPIGLTGDLSGDEKPKQPVTPDVIIRHCKGWDSVSLYAIAQDNTSRWVCLDVDDHDEKRHEKNTAYVFNLVGWVREFGFDPLVENSDGGGGWHIWILLSEPTLSEVAYRFGHWLVESVYPAANCGVNVEVFPGQECLTETTLYGSAMRVPGYHQKRQVWSRILSRTNGQFLDLPTDEAIELLTSYGGNSPLLIPRDAKSYTPLTYKRRWLGSKTEWPDDEDDESISGLFSCRNSWEQVLEPHGWQAVQVASKVTYWRRPGKYIGGHSATTGYCGRNLYVFSDDDGCRPFIKGETYSKWQAHCLLNFGGDGEAAEADFLFNNQFQEEEV